MSDVRRKESAKVAAMTSFPLPCGFDAGDEGKYTRRQFLCNYSRLFGENIADSIDESDPMCGVAQDGVVIVTSKDALSLNFKKYSSGFKLIAYLIEP